MLVCIHEFTLSFLHVFQPKEVFQEHGRGGTGGSQGRFTVRTQWRTNRQEGCLDASGILMHPTLTAQTLRAAELSTRGEEGGAAIATQPRTTAGRLEVLVLVILPKAVEIHKIHAVYDRFGVHSPAFSEVMIVLAQCCLFSIVASGIWAEADWAGEWLHENKAGTGTCLQTSQTLTSARLMCVCVGHCAYMHSRFFAKVVCEVIAAISDPG